jgi:hypothetical protein
MATSQFMMVRSIDKRDRVGSATAWVHGMAWFKGRRQVKTQNEISHKWNHLFH